MKILFEKNTIYRNDKKIKDFEFPIFQIVVFDNAIIVLLDRDYYNVNNENVFCIDYDGNLLWQVPIFEYSDKRSPFVEIKKEGENIKLFNWGGEFALIEPFTGNIIVHPKDSNKRPW